MFMLKWAPTFNKMKKIASGASSKKTDW